MSARERERGGLPSPNLSLSGRKAGQGLFVYDWKNRMTGARPGRLVISQKNTCASGAFRHNLHVKITHHHQAIFMGHIYNNIVETVGRTPLVRLNRVTAGLPATVLLKCEFFNPLGSVKDRIGMAMIEDAERRGILKKETVIIEPTSGNTGIALAFVAAAKGYQLILTMPETMSLERRTLLAMLGAKLVLTPGTEGMKGAIAKAEQLAKEIPMPGFRSSSRTRPTRKSTAKPPPRKSGRTPTARWTSLFPPSARAARSPAVAKSSSRASRRFRPSPSSRRIRRSFRRPWPASRLKPGPHKIQGTGAGFIPKNLHLKDSKGNPQIVECIQVTNEDSFAMARRLAKEEGILAGISSGANVWAAMEVAKRPENKGKMIVTVACSTGERYFSTPLAAEARAQVGG